MTPANGHTATSSYNITSMINPPKKEGDTGMALVKLLIAIPFTFATGAWNAFVLWKLYGWFLLPLGAPALSWAHLWGIFMFFFLALAGFRPDRSSDGLGSLTRSILMVFVSATALLFGWIVSGWL